MVPFMMVVIFCKVTPAHLLTVILFYMLNWISVLESQVLEFWNRCIQITHMLLEPGI